MGPVAGGHGAGYLWMGPGWGHGPLRGVWVGAVDQLPCQGDAFGAGAVGSEVGGAEVGPVDEDGELACESGPGVDVDAACCPVEAVQQLLPVLLRDPAGWVVVVVVLGGGVAEGASPEVGSPQVAFDSVKDGVESRAGIHAVVDLVVDELQDGGGVTVEVGTDELVLGGKHPVDAHLAKAGLGDQPVHPNRVDTVGGEETGCRVQDYAAPFVGGEAGCAGALLGGMHVVSVLGVVTDPSQLLECVAWIVPERW